MVLVGGSSRGLPRFRAVCGGQVLLELKAARVAAYDYAMDSQRKNQPGSDARIQQGTTSLDAGRYLLGPATAQGLLFAQDPRLGLFPYYIHDRNYRELPVDDLKSSKLVDLARVLGIALGNGHRVTGLKSLGKQDQTHLIKGLSASRDVWAKWVAKDYEKVPSCIP